MRFPDLTPEEEDRLQEERMDRLDEQEEREARLLRHGPWLGDLDEWGDDVEERKEDKHDAALER